MQPHEIPGRATYCVHICSKLDRVPARDVVPHVPGFDIDRILGPGYMLEINHIYLEIGDDKDKVKYITEMTYQGVITTEFDVIRSSRSHRCGVSQGQLRGATIAEAIRMSTPPSFDPIKNNCWDYVTSFMGNVGWPEDDSMESISLAEIEMQLRHALQAKGEDMRTFLERNPEALSILCRSGYPPALHAKRLLERGPN